MSPRLAWLSRTPIAAPSSGISWNSLSNRPMPNISRGLPERVFVAFWCHFFVRVNDLVMGLYNSASRPFQLFTRQAHSSEREKQQSRSQKTAQKAHSRSVFSSAWLRLSNHLHLVHRVRFFGTRHPVFENGFGETSSSTRKSLPHGAEAPLN